MDTPNVPVVTPHRTSPVGALLQYWRKARRLSQLDLATQADVSARHLCFVETGRAKPSREMVLVLAESLNVPLRERNALLLAAGFAPVFEETPLDAPTMATVRAALDAILRHQEPFPAVVMNRGWDIVLANAAATRLFSFLLDGASPPGPANVIRLMFDPGGLRPTVRNWPAVARALLQRVQREVVCGVRDPNTSRLLDEVLAYPDVPELLRIVEVERLVIPVIPVSFFKGDLELDFFSTVTTLGTPQDITLQELRIESFFPASANTEARARTFAE